MAKSKSIKEIAAEAESLCAEVYWQSLGYGEDTRSKASLLVGIQNREKLDEISGKLDKMADAFNRLAAAIETNNDLIRTEQEERSRNVKKVKLGDASP